MAIVIILLLVCIIPIAVIVLIVQAIVKRNNKEEINFIYDLKKEYYKKYAKEYKKEWNEEIQKKLFERYIKENGKHIKIITVKGERIGFFDEKILEDNTFKIDNIFIINEYSNKGIETAISNEVLLKNKNIIKKLRTYSSNLK